VARGGLIESGDAVRTEMAIRARMEIFPRGWNWKGGGLSQSWGEGFSPCAGRAALRREPSRVRFASTSRGCAFGVWTGARSWAWAWQKVGIIFATFSFSRQLQIQTIFKKTLRSSEHFLSRLFQVGSVNSRVFSANILFPHNLLEMLQKSFICSTNRCC
jgi:hypothetical protein